MEVSQMNISSMSTTTKLKMQVAILAIPSLALVPTIATIKAGQKHVSSASQRSPLGRIGNEEATLGRVGDYVAAPRSGPIAQRDFDGTWKIDLGKSTMTDKPDVFLLQGGSYQCKTCVPIINVKADGEDHRVTGSPYYDAISIKVLGDQGIERIGTQNWKTVATSRMTLSADGATATVEFTDSSNANSDPVTWKETVSRLGKTKRLGIACSFGVLASLEDRECLGQRACAHVQG
jgi:hypothetical protein